MQFMTGSDAEFLKDYLIGIQMTRDVDASLSALNPDAIYKGIKNLTQKKKGIWKEVLMIERCQQS